MRIEPLVRRILEVVDLAHVYGDDAASEADESEPEALQQQQQGEQGKILNGKKPSEKPPPQSSVTCDGFSPSKEPSGSGLKSTAGAPPTGATSKRS